MFLLMILSIQDILSVVFAERICRNVGILFVKNATGHSAMTARIRNGRSGIA